MSGSCGLRALATVQVTNHDPLAWQRGQRWTAATIVTTDGLEYTATLVQPPGWRYALAVRIAEDHSLLGAALK
jgi:hypothetical protein